MAFRSGLGAPAERGDPGSFRIGSIAGIDVLVRASWLLVAALIAYVIAPQIESTSPDLGALTYVAGLAFAILLTLSLLLHEVSHALMAKRFGIRVRSITIHFIGGVTAIDGEPANARQELAISGVGPLTSLGIGGAAWLVLQVTPDGLLSLVVWLLAWANLVVGALNLVPGLPLDGGRVLRAAVWGVTGNPNRGTVVAGWAGRVIALMVLALPWVLSWLGATISVIDYVIAFVLGWFLWSAASSAITSGQIRALLPALQARRLARRVHLVPEDTPLSEAMRQAQEAQAGALVTLGPDGAPNGIVSEAAARATPEERRPWLPASTVSRALTPGLQLSADLHGEDMVRALQATPASEYLLVEADGRVYGVLVTADVDAAYNQAARDGR